MIAQYDLIYKIIFTGESGVGKTSLHDRYAYNKFQENRLPMMVCDFLYKDIIIKRKTIRLQLWDTAGQERYKTMNSMFYKNAQGIIMVYDVGNMESFKALENRWLKNINQYGKEFSKIIVLGNKIDLQQQQMEVSFEQGKQFAESINAQFAEVSAKTGENIEESVQQFGQTIFNYREENNLNQHNAIQLQNIQQTKNNNNKKCSC